MTARHGCPAVSHRSDVSGHSRADAPLSQPLCPGTGSFSVLLITHMPVGHLSAASTDLHICGFHQLSRFVSACLKTSTAAGELKIICGAVVSRLVRMRAAECMIKIPLDWTMLPCWLHPHLFFFSLDSFTTKAPVRKLHHSHRTFHYPWLSRKLRAKI